MPMYNPPYPGAILKECILPELGLDIDTAANQIGIDPLILTSIMDGTVPIDTDIAIRLNQWLGKNSTSAECWIRQQTAYDLWQKNKKRHSEE